MTTKKNVYGSRFVDTAVLYQLGWIAAIMITLAMCAHLSVEYMEHFHTQVEDHRMRLRHWERNCGPGVERFGYVSCEKEWGILHSSPHLQAFSSTVWHVFSEDLNPMVWIGCGTGSYCRAKLGTLLDFGMGTGMFVAPVLIVGFLVFVVRICVNRYILGNPAPVSPPRVVFVDDRRAIADTEYSGTRRRSPYLYEQP